DASGPMRREGRLVGGPCARADDVLRLYAGETPTDALKRLCQEYYLDSWDAMLQATRVAGARDDGVPGQFRVQLEVQGKPVNRELRVNSYGMLMKPGATPRTPPPGFAWTF